MGKLKANTGKVLPPTAIDHITVEEQEDGKLKLHFSPPRRPNEKKPWWDSEKILSPATKNGAHLATFAIKRPKALDLAGSALRRIPTPSSLSVPDAERAAEGMLAPHHPVLELPEAWTPDKHLQVNFVLTDDHLKDEDYPRVWIKDPALFDAPFSMPEHFILRHTAFELPNQTRLIVMLAVFGGVPKRDVTVLDYTGPSLEKPTQVAEKPGPRVKGYPPGPLP